MVEPLAFICFDPERSQASYRRFMDEKPSCPVAFSVDDASLSVMLPRSDWARLRGRIGRCDLMIVLLDPEAGSSAIVAEAIPVARSTNVPFFAIYPHEGPLSELPAGLAPNRTISWDWSLIGKAVQQLSSEGKNHKFK